MSLLTDTQGTPSRVFALLRLAREAGPLSNEALADWMDPLRNEDEGPSTAVTQTVGAARSLQFLTDKWPVSALIDPGEDAGEFSDIAHRQLCSSGADDADSLILGAYCWLLLQMESDHPTRYQTNAKFSDAVAGAFPREGTDAKTFNSTKYGAWSKWLSFIGLGFDMDGWPFYPYPVERLARELRAAGKDLGFDRDLDFSEVHDRLKTRMPYLDGGAIFEEVAERTGLRPRPRTLSRVFAMALRDLHSDGEIKIIAWGDSTRGLTLPPDPNDHSGLQGIDIIRILGERSNAA